MGIDREERLRRGRLRIQVIEDEGSWYVVYMGFGKSAGPFKTKNEADKFKRKVVNAEAAEL